MSYRPDIDGLRAIAVLSVIVYHLDNRWLPGGFAGVDMFFVISGYLITLYVLQEQQLGRFSLAEFYRRRIRRIMPAALLVIAVTVLASQLLMRPEDAEFTARSAIWSIASVANVFFWLYQDSSYFAAASDELTLLHLWSLGVEEQFYVFWPLCLMAASLVGRRRGFWLTVFVIALASFALAEWLFPKAPRFVYYMLPTRGGELLIGALIAMLVNAGWADSFRRSTSNFLAAAGIVGLLYTLWATDSSQAFPGLQAGPPALATAALILAGTHPSNSIVRLLSARPLVIIGLLSYSAYLLHWPIIALLRYGGIEIDPLTAALVIMTTFALSWLTYRFIEQPARRSSSSFGKVFTRFLLIPGVALFALAAVILKTDGMSLRPGSTQYIADIDRIRQSSRPAYAYASVCQVQKVSTQLLQNSRCVIGPDSAIPPAALLLGDSNAAHYVGVLDEIANARGFRVRNLQIQTCPPILHAPGSQTVATRVVDCKLGLQQVAETLDRYEVILLSADFVFYHGLFDEFRDAFEQSVEWLTTRGHRVILLGKIANAPGFDRLCREKALSFPGKICDQVETTINDDVASANQWLASIAENNRKVDFVDVNLNFCAGDSCPVRAEGFVNYYDSDHLTIDASYRLGKKIVDTGLIPEPLKIDLPSQSNSR